MPMNPRTMGCYRIADGWDIQVSHFRFKFSATEPLSLGHLRTGARNYDFQGTFENKKILINTILTSNLLCNFNRICQWCETENQVFTPRRAKDEEQIDPDTEQSTLTTQKQLNIAHRESRNVDSESFRTCSFCLRMENGQFHISNESVSSEPTNSQSSRLKAVLTDHVQIGQQ